ncbi:MAG TPA: carboxypeptidase-like regulatory domain-containing protein [Bryobacteraceae bacterium]|nr:carboxypeptidase-like regulatory domain-containing protein [Bryobacteraceae bacterium]
MKPLALLFLTASAGMAAITGTVINRTTGKPQEGATVVLNLLAQQGITMIDQAKSDAQGHFTINQDLQPGGPSLLRTAFDGVTYNHMLPPGSATSGITVDVYNSSTNEGAAKVSKHMLLFEPAGGQMVVNETYLFTNSGNLAWNDSDHGTMHFYLPPGAKGKVEVNATAPGGMPIPAATLKTGKPDTLAVDFPVKPGETRFDLTYTTSYNSGDEYIGKILTKDDNTYLIAPNGITLTGDHLSDMGTEPRTQAHIWGFEGNSYKIKLTGTEAAAPSDADTSTAQGDSSDSGPQIEQIMPRLYSKTVLILVLALGILAVGFALLYRAPVGTPKESNERGRG